MQENQGTSLRCLLNFRENGYFYGSYHGTYIERDRRMDREEDGRDDRSGNPAFALDYKCNFGGEERQRDRLKKIMFPKYAFTDVSAITENCY